jgi:hypothetical protein
MEILTLLLPAVWALIASGIGLLLFKSSEAVFESVERANKRTKRLRLAGSVLIAVFAFWGMKGATPAGRLRGREEGTIPVPISKVEESFDVATRLDRATLELSGCIERSSCSLCRNDAEQVRNDAVLNVEKVKALAGRPN